MQNPLSLPQDSPNPASDLPLSAAQAGVWYAQQLAPTDPLYNIGGYVEIFGSVNPGGLRTAIEHAIQEADSFQFTFAVTEQGPRQISSTVADVALPILDLSGAVDPRGAAAAWMDSEMDRPFDLSGGPLYRFALIKIAPAHTLWFCAFHHLITDLFGATLFLHRTRRSLQRRDGRPAALPRRVNPVVRGAAGRGGVSSLGARLE